MHPIVKIVIGDIIDDRVELLRIADKAGIGLTTLLKWKQHTPRLDLIVAVANARGFDKDRFAVEIGPISHRVEILGKLDEWRHGRKI